MYGYILAFRHMNFVKVWGENVKRILRQQRNTPREWREIARHYKYFAC